MSKKKNKGWDYLNSDDLDDLADNSGDSSYINSDGSGSYYGADGSWGYRNSDGSGSYYGGNGDDSESYTSVAHKIWCFIMLHSIIYMNYI